VFLYIYIAMYMCIFPFLFFPFCLLWWVGTTCDVVLIFLTATSYGSPAAGRGDLCYTLIAPCSAKIVHVAFLSLITPYLITAGNYLSNPCATVPGVNRSSPVHKGLQF
jgi:hypothetical protein